MTELGKVQYPSKAHVMDAFGLHSPLLVVLLAAKVALASPAAVPGQQRAQTVGRNQGVAANTKTQAQTAMIQHQAKGI